MCNSLNAVRQAVRSQAIVLMVLLGALGAKDALAAGPQVCPLVPYATYVMYAYWDSESNIWQAEGWFRREAGECLQLPESTVKPYIYAEVDPEDVVAQAIGSAHSEWSGDEGQGGVLVCVPQEKFHRALDSCDGNDRKIWIDPLEQQTLELTSGKVTKHLGFSIESPAQAAYVARNIKGQILFGRLIANEPKGAPYRIGTKLEADANGVYVTAVSAGMPADGLLQPGDRIAQIAGATVQSVPDAVLAIQRFGMMSDPRNRILQIKLWRWKDIGQPPQLLAADLQLAYYRNLDPRLNAELKAMAARVATADGVLWGFREQAVCGLQGLSEERPEAPAHLRHLSCTEIEALGAAMLAEMYPDVTRTFDLIGSGFSPRLVFRSAARRSLGAGARLALAVTDEAVQGGLTVIGQASSSSEITPPAILKGMALGAGVGAVTGIVLGQ